MAASCFEDKSLLLLQSTRHWKCGFALLVRKGQNYWNITGAVVRKQGCSQLFFLYIQTAPFKMHRGILFGFYAASVYDFKWQLNFSLYFLDVVKSTHLRESPWPQQCQASKEVLNCNYTSPRKASWNRITYKEILYVFLFPCFPFPIITVHVILSSCRTHVSHFTSSFIIEKLDSSWERMYAYTPKTIPKYSLVVSLHHRINNSSCIQIFLLQHNFLLSTHNLSALAIFIDFHMNPLSTKVPCLKNSFSCLFAFFIYHVISLVVGQHQ